MFEAVIKCGGSLSHGDSLRALCRRLAVLGRRHPLLLVPGGGPFADAVREADRHFRLSDDAAHWMAILAMDQYGFLLTDLIPESLPAKDLREAREIADAGCIPVLLPFDLLRRADPLPHSWEVTSDSLGAWIAQSAGASTLVLLKDVEGLYANVPPREERGDHMETVTMEQIAACEGVDRYLATFLSASSLDLWIINGNDPRRLEELLERGTTKGTRLRR